MIGGATSQARARMLAKEMGAHYIARHVPTRTVRFLDVRLNELAYFIPDVCKFRRRKEVKPALISLVDFEEL